MRIRCNKCHRKYRWTRARCPRCKHPNDGSPMMRIGRVVATVLLIAAMCCGVWVYAKHGGAGKVDTGSEDAAPAQFPEQNSRKSRPQAPISFTR